MFREDCSKFKYLTLCIKEVLRLYPPATEVSRCLEHDTEVDGRTLKAGTQVDIHIYSLHHHPDFWDKPEVSCCDKMTGWGDLIIGPYSWKRSNFNSPLFQE